VGKRPSRSFTPTRKAPNGRPPVLTPAEIAQLDPKDVPSLGNGSGTKSRSNGSRTNGSRSSSGSGSRSTASSRSRANRTAKSTTGRRTTRKQADGGGGQQAPGTTG
jgi:hypothetical protein